MKEKTLHKWSNAMREVPDGRMELRVWKWCFYSLAVATRKMGRCDYERNT